MGACGSECRKGIRRGSEYFEKVSDSFWSLFGRSKRVIRKKMNDAGVTRCKKDRKKMKKRKKTNGFG